jgi:hypothetical protein
MSCTGQKKVNVHIAEAPRAEGAPAHDAAAQSSKDEIKLYLDGRYLCAMDAMWRILGYHTYPAPCPSVQTVKIKTPSEVNALLADHKSCDMLAYIHRPRALSHLKYAELFTTYICGKSPRGEQMTKFSAPVVSPPID